MDKPVEGTPLRLRTELPYGEKLDEHLTEMFEDSQRADLVRLFKAELRERGFAIVSLSPLDGVKRD